MFALATSLPIVSTRISGGYQVKMYVLFTSRDEREIKCRKEHHIKKHHKNVR